MFASSHTLQLLPPTSRAPRRGPWRWRSLAALAVTAALGLTACGTGPDDPTEAAEQFANQLGSQDFEALQDTTLTEASISPEDLRLATESLAQYPVTVTVDEATLDEQENTADDTVTATANYTVSWDLSGGTTSDDDEQTEENELAEEDHNADDLWSYTTAGTLVWQDEAEAWVPELTADTLVSGLANEGRVVVEVEAADRGDILDTHAEPLATDRPVQRIGIDKTHVLQALQAQYGEPSDEQVTETLTESATELAEALELDPEPLVERTLAAGERAWVEFIVLREDEDTDIPFDAIVEIQGAMAMEDTMVLGPTRSFARGLLGTYGQPSAEQIEASDGEFTAGVATGLSGLQRTYNAQLNGSDGLHISVDNTGASQIPDSEPVTYSREVTDGESITTTLDAEVQQLAESMIDEADIPAGLVVVRPSDGHILAAADGPEETSWPLAVTGSYPPGSTFKMVAALAMLRNGMTPESTVSCPASLNIGGTEISNFDGYPSEYVGEITLADAIAQSCNTAFVGQYEEISPQQIHDAAAALGLVAEPIIGFDGAILGSVPTDVEDAQHAAGLFGQGLVEASPLGMATVAASVANGQTVAPLLVTEPGVDPTENANLPGEEPLTEQEADALAQLMAGPVANGTVPILQDVPGAPVLAKTGTAQYIEDGEDLAHTWIMATHGDLAVSLFYTEGFAGAQTNGPVLQEFLTELEEIIPST